MAPSYWIIGLAAGAASGLLYLSPTDDSLFSVITAYLAPLPLFLAGLGWGSAICLLAGIAGLLLVGVVQSLMPALAYLAMTAGPAFWLVRLALLSRPAPANHAENASAEGRMSQPDYTAWYPAGYLVVWTSGIAGALFLALAIWFLGTDGGLKGAVRSLLAGQNLDALNQALRAAEIALSAQEFLDMVSAMFPAAAAIFWVWLTLGNLWLGQFILTRTGQALRPPPHIPHMQFPPSFAFVLTGAMVLSLFPGQTGFIGGTLTAILIVPYFLLGLAIVHAISRDWPARVLILGLLYLLIIYLGLPALLVCVLGIIEPWAQLRRRFA